MIYSDEIIRGMAKADWMAESSHDPDTQTGCAIYKEGHFIGGASNRIPYPIIATKERTTRPEKYDWIEHCERRAIYSFKGDLGELEGSTMYLNWFPCADCARAIVAVQIAKLVCVMKEERMCDPRYGFKQSMEILQAGSVELIEFKKEMQ